MNAANTAATSSGKGIIARIEQQLATGTPAFNCQMRIGTFAQWVNSADMHQQIAGCAFFQ
jgi:hypothetical protein